MYQERRRRVFYGDLAGDTVLYTQFLAGPLAQTNAVDNGDGPELCSFIGLPVKLTEYGCYESFVKPIPEEKIAEVAYREHVPKVFSTVRGILKNDLPSIKLSFLSDYLEYNSVIDQWLNLVRNMDNGFAAIDLAPVLTFSFSDNPARTIIIDAGMHDREWTAIETLLDFTRQLTDLVLSASAGDKFAIAKLMPLQNTRIVIVPVVDLYGFIKTTMVYNTPQGPLFTERLNRSQTYMGADPNRSFPFCWAMNDGSNLDPQFGDSSGMFQLSLPCSRAMFGLMNRYKKTGTMLLDLHSYGNLIIAEPTPSTSFMKSNHKHQGSKKTNYQYDIRTRKTIDTNREVHALALKFKQLLLTHISSLGFRSATPELLPYVACGTLTQTAFHYFSYLAAALEIGNMEDKFAVTDRNLFFAHETATHLIDWVTSVHVEEMCGTWLKHKEVLQQQLPEEIVYLD